MLCEFNTVMQLGVIMDPISGIKIGKDTTFAILLAAQRRGWEMLYMEMSDLFMRDGRPGARMRRLQVQDDAADWYCLAAERRAALSELDLILMRKDPPVDMEYLYSTCLLEQAEGEGVLVVNKPAGLRDANEKLIISHFPQCAAPTLVTRSAEMLRDFIEEHGDIILKPLDGMGGASVFRTHTQDANAAVIIETLTQHGRRFTMAQRYLKEIAQGDKRILMIDGRPLDYALARIPAPGEIRGNLAAGGRGKGVSLSERDRWICAQVAPVLRKKGLLFVGLDVIGDYLTEINVTSPTCVRELDAIYHIDIAGQFMDVVAEKLRAP